MAGRPLRLLLAVCLVAAVSCADEGPQPAPVDVTGRTAVGEVRLQVPEGWEPGDDEAPPGVLDTQRWRPAGAELTGLQLVVACGGTLDQLVVGVSRTARHGLQVTDTAEIEGADVPGLDATRGLVIDLEGSLAGVEAGQLRTAGLYGQTGEALFLLELTQRAAEFDAELAERIFATVEVEDGLAARCDEEDT